MFKRNLGSYTCKQYTYFDDKNYHHPSVAVFPSIQVTNNKLVDLKVRVPRFIISAELERRLQKSLERRPHISLQVQIPYKLV